MCNKYETYTNLLRIPVSLFYSLAKICILFWYTTCGCRESSLQKSKNMEKFPDFHHPCVE